MSRAALAALVGLVWLPGLLASGKRPHSWPCNAARQASNTGRAEVGAGRPPECLLARRLKWEAVREVLVAPVSYRSKHGWCCRSRHLLPLPLPRGWDPCMLRSAPHLQPA